MSVRPAENTKISNLVIIGCGKLGTSILVGLYKAYVQYEQLHTLNISATVRSPQSQERLERVVSQLQTEFISLPEDKCTISVQLQNNNGALLSKADIVILACKPSMYEGICRGNTPYKTCAPLSGQIWISLVGGTACANIENVLQSDTKGTLAPPRFVVRAIPNIAAQIRQSMTTLALPEAHSYNSNQADEVICKTTQLFSLVGSTMWVPEKVMNITSTIGASAVALFATLIDQVAQGAYAADGDISSDALLEVAARAASGAAGLVIEGMSPHAIVNQVATRGGSTRVGLDMLESCKSASAIQGAVKATITATQGLSIKN